MGSPPPPPEWDDSLPRPGSSEAVAQGCICPIYDNNHGAGSDQDGGWDVLYGCPLHWPKTADASDKQ